MKEKIKYIFLEIVNILLIVAFIIGLLSLAGLLLKLIILVSAVNLFLGIFMASCILFVVCLAIVLLIHD